MTLASLPVSIPAATRRRVVVDKLDQINLALYDRQCEMDISHVLKLPENEERFKRDRDGLIEVQRMLQARLADIDAEDKSDGAVPERRDVEQRDA